MKLYVGNLPYSATEEELRELFGAYGAPTSVSIVVDRYSGRSRGFAFVEFADAGEAQAAIDGLNGKEFGGRTLTVNEARSDRGGRGGAGGRGERGGPRRGPGGGRDWS
jgi:RNA recognition motif-containing protein